MGNKRTEVKRTTAFSRVEIGELPLPFRETPPERWEWNDGIAGQIGGEAARSLLSYAYEAKNVDFLFMASHSDSIDKALKKEAKRFLHILATKGAKHKTSLENKVKKRALTLPPINMFHATLDLTLPALVGLPSPYETFIALPIHGRKSLNLKCALLDYNNGEFMDGALILKSARNLEEAIAEYCKTNELFITSFKIAMWVFADFTRSHSGNYYNIDSLLEINNVIDVFYSSVGDEFLHKELFTFAPDELSRLKNATEKALEHKFLRGYFPPNLDRLERRIMNAQASPLVISPEQTYERVMDEVEKEIVESFSDPSVRMAHIRFLRDAAHLLADMGEMETARLVAGAALLLWDKSISPIEIGLIKKSYTRLIKRNNPSDKNEAKSKDERKEEAKPRIIIP
ncbi:MAG: hypothetical protein Kow0090_19480 [Myxococcota bacterium]